METKFREKSSYELTVQGGKFTAMRPLSSQDDPRVIISEDGRNARAGLWTVSIHVGDGKYNRMVVRYPGYGGRHHPLGDGVLRLSYRGNGRAYSTLLPPEDLPENRPTLLPFKFSKFHIGRGYRVPKTDGTFSWDWVTNGDLARELNWVFSDGEVKYRFADSGQEISSLDSPELRNACDTLEAVVSHSSWMVHARLEQRGATVRRSIKLYCSEDWIGITATDVKACLADYLKHRCAGAGSFSAPLTGFLC